jgi:hypothetical protein
MRCGDYNRKIQAFSVQLRDLFARNVTPAERDYYDIEDNHRRVGSRQFVKLLVSQVAKGRNPYAYLLASFLKNDVRVLLRRQQPAIEQVVLPHRV